MREATPSICEGLRAVALASLRHDLARRIRPAGRMLLSMEIEALSARAMEIRQRFAEFEQVKFRREWTKEEVMQGFVVDVGDLMKLVMAKSGIRHVDDVDRKLEHELADCLWCVLVLAKMYQIDIGPVFMRTMDELDTWIAEKKK